MKLLQTEDQNNLQALLAALADPSIHMDSTLRSQVLYWSLELKPKRTRKTPTISEPADLAA